MVALYRKTKSFKKNTSHAFLHSRLFVWLVIKMIIVVMIFLFSASSACLYQSAHFHFKCVACICSFKCEIIEINLNTLNYLQRVKEWKNLLKPQKKLFWSYRFFYISKVETMYVESCNAVNMKSNVLIVRKKMFQILRFRMFSWLYQN